MTLTQISQYNEEQRQWNDNSIFSGGNAKPKDQRANIDYHLFQDFQLDIYFQEKWEDKRLVHNNTKRILVKVSFIRE